MEHRKIPIHHSLTDPLLIGLVEKDYLFLIFIITPVPVLLGGMELVYIATSIFVFILNYIIGIVLAEKDPYMFATIIRHIKYQEFYDAQEFYGYVNKFGWQKNAKINNLETPNSLPE